jgi:tetratricopeptide (TPR) repeat protein
MMSLHCARLGLILLCLLTASLMLKAELFQNATEKERGEKNKSNYFDNGVTEYNSSRFQEAIIDFSNAIKQDSANWKAYKYKANSERNLKLYKNAILDYTKAISINKFDTSSYKERANCNRFIKNCAAAIDDYDFILKFDPSDIPTIFGRAMCRNQLEYFQLALDDYDICIKSLPKRSILYQARGFVYYNMKKYDATIRDFLKYRQLGGKDSKAIYFIAECYLHLSNENASLADSAIYYIKKYQESNSDAPSYRILGQAYETKGDSSVSFNNFRKSFELDSTSKELYFEWGGAEVNFDNYSKALVHLHRALNKEVLPSSELFYRIGLAKEGLRDTADAVQFFSKAIQVDDDRIDIYKTRFDFIGNNLKYTDLALSDLDNIIRLDLDKNEQAGLYAVRSLLFLRKKDFEQAKLSVEKAIILDPNNTSNYLLRAYLRMGGPLQESLVLADLNKVISINANIAEAYILKCLFYFSKGDIGASCENIKYAKKLGAKVSKTIVDYVCKNKEPKNTRELDLNFLIYPYLQGQLQNPMPKKTLH